MIEAKYNNERELYLIVKVQSLIRMFIAVRNYRRSKVDPDAFMLASPADNPNMWFRFLRVQRWQDDTLDDKSRVAMIFKYLGEYEYGD